VAKRKKRERKNEKRVQGDKEATVQKPDKTQSKIQKRQSVRVQPERGTKGYPHPLFQQKAQARKDD